MHIINSQITVNWGHPCLLCFKGSISLLLCSFWVSVSMSNSQPWLHTESFGGFWKLSVAESWFSFNLPGGKTGHQYFSKVLWVILMCRKEWESQISSWKQLPIWSNYVPVFVCEITLCTRPSPLLVVLVYIPKWQIQVLFI